MSLKPISDYPAEIQALVASMLQLAEDDIGDPNQRARMAFNIQDVIDRRAAAVTAQHKAMCAVLSNTREAMVTLAALAGSHLNRAVPWATLDAEARAVLEPNAKFTGPRVNNWRSDEQD